MRLAGLRHRLRPHEIPAAVRAIMDEKHAALRILRERHDAARQSERIARRTAAASPRPP
jgi:hypothetical protein